MDRRVSTQTASTADIFRRKNQSTLRRRASITKQFQVPRQRTPAAERRAQRRHHAFLQRPDNAAALRALGDRVRGLAAMDPGALGHRLGPTDVQRFEAWAADLVRVVDPAAVPFRPSPSPSSDPLHQVLMRLQFLQDAHVCLVEVDIEARQLLARWEREGVFDDVEEEEEEEEDPGGSDDAAAEGTMDGATGRPLQATMGTGRSNLVLLDDEDDGDAGDAYGGGRGEGGGGGGGTMSNGAPTSALAEWRSKIESSYAFQRLRERSAGRMIKRNVARWARGRETFRSRVEEMEVFGNTTQGLLQGLASGVPVYYHQRLAANSVLGLGGGGGVGGGQDFFDLMKARRDPGGERAINFKELMQFSKHLALFTVDHALRRVDELEVKRRLFELRCLIKLQTWWRKMHDVVQGRRMMRLLAEVRRKKEEEESERSREQRRREGRTPPTDASGGSSRRGLGKGTATATGNGSKGPGSKGPSSGASTNASSSSSLSSTSAMGASGRREEDGDGPGTRFGPRGGGRNRLDSRAMLQSSTAADGKPLTPKGPPPAKGSGARKPGIGAPMKTGDGIDGGVNGSWRGREGGGRSRRNVEGEGGRHGRLHGKFGGGGGDDDDEVDTKDVEDAWTRFLQAQAAEAEQIRQEVEGMAAEERLVRAVLQAERARPGSSDNGPSSRPSTRARIGTPPDGAMDLDGQWRRWSDDDEDHEDDEDEDGGGDNGDMDARSDGLPRSRASARSTPYSSRPQSTATTSTELGTLAMGEYRPVTPMKVLVSINGLPHPDTPRMQTPTDPSKPTTPMPPSTPTTPSHGRRRILLLSGEGNGSRRGQQRQSLPGTGRLSIMMPFAEFNGPPPVQGSSRRIIPQADQLSTPRRHLHEMEFAGGDDAEDTAMHVFEALVDAQTEEHEEQEALAAQSPPPPPGAMIVTPGDQLAMAGGIKRSISPVRIFASLRARRIARMRAALRRKQLGTQVEGEGGVLLGLPDEPARSPRMPSRESASGEARGSTAGADSPPLSQVAEWVLNTSPTGRRIHGRESVVAAYMSNPMLKLDFRKEDVMRSPTVPSTTDGDVVLTARARTPAATVSLDGSSKFGSHAEWLASRGLGEFAKGRETMQPRHRRVIGDSPAREEDVAILPQAPRSVDRSKQKRRMQLLQKQQQQREKQKRVAQHALPILRKRQQQDPTTTSPAKGPSSSTPPQASAPAANGDETRHAAAGSLPPLVGPVRCAAGETTASKPRPPEPRRRPDAGSLASGGVDGEDHDEDMTEDEASEGNDHDPARDGPETDGSESGSASDGSLTAETAENPELSLGGPGGESTATKPRPRRRSRRRRPAPTSNKRRRGTRSTEENDNGTTPREGSSPVRVRYQRGHGRHSESEEDGPSSADESQDGAMTVGEGWRRHRPPSLLQRLVPKRRRRTVDLSADPYDVGVGELTADGGDSMEEEDGEDGLDDEGMSSPLHPDSAGVFNRLLNQYLGLLQVGPAY